VLKYIEDAIDRLGLYHGGINVLDWWQQSGLHLKVYQDVIHYAVYKGSIEDLKWWAESRLELKYDHSSIDEANKNGNLKVLQT